MAAIGKVKIKVPAFPECWDSCGNCAQGDVVVVEVHVAVGQTLNVDDRVIVLDTGKVALDIPSPQKGIVVEVFVKVGDKLTAGQILCTLDGRLSAGQPATGAQ
jgi:pyruvate/2-oxoglutarate dehydrogenase complex dihydrolipoamide acyltransferase (E2) component